jgi:lipoprotein-anchoring transpeptidase ErfK/SrfK
MVAQSSSIDRYEDVLARAIAASSSEASERAVIYDRARAALLERLRSARPPLPDVAIDAERQSLEAAIDRVEMRFAAPDDDAYEPSPAVPHRLRDRQRGALIAVICCAGIVLALLVGIFSYQYRRDILRSANQGFRQATVQPIERTSASSNDASTTEALPYVFKRQLVYYRTTSPAGTLVIDKSQRYLYVILANVSAIRYGIAVGGNCTEASGRYTVSRKLEPSAPPQSSQPVQSAGRSPSRALYLDSETHLIHGTDASSSIGRSVNAGCFLLVQADLAELYGRVPVGTRVMVN